MGRQKLNTDRMGKSGERAWSLRIGLRAKLLQVCRKVPKVSTCSVHQNLATAKIAKMIAAASSMTAAGKSLPNAFANRPRIAAPPYVPKTAPITPASRPNITEPEAALTVAPTSAPLRIRAINCGGTLRLAVFGSLSLINSPMARTVKIMGVYLNPINAIGVPATAKVPKRAAQLATAGEVMVRNPDTIPSTNATTRNIRPSFRFLRFDLGPQRET